MAGRGISSVCVYCGSRTGHDPAHAAAASALGHGLASRGHALVYGAGGIGLMNVVADAVIARKGVAIGVIPRHLAELELKHNGLSETVLVDTMHERKQIMFERADAFVVLPGGFGTLDELFEILTWKMLGLHDKPVYVLNSQGYWDPLEELIRQVIGHGFAGPETAALLTFVPDVERLFRALDSHVIETPVQARAHLA